MWLTAITGTKGVVAKWVAMGATAEWIVYVDSSTLAFELYDSLNGLAGRSVALTTALYQAQWVRLMFTYTVQRDGSGGGDLPQWGAGRYDQQRGGHVCR